MPENNAENVYVFNGDDGFWKQPFVTSDYTRCYKREHNMPYIIFREGSCMIVSFGIGTVAGGIAGVLRAIYFPGKKGFLAKMLLVGSCALAAKPAIEITDDMRKFMDKTYDVVVDTIEMRKQADEADDPEEEC